MPVKNLLSPRALPGLIVAAAGAVLLLNNFGVISLGGFQRFWPLLLIAFGAHVLVDGGSNTFGVIIVLVGIALQLDNLDLLSIDLRDLMNFWPVLLILLGAQMLVKPTGKDNSFGGILLLCLGAYFLARNFGFVSFGLQQLWPVIVIAAGVGMLRKAMARA